MEESEREESGKEIGDSDELVGKGGEQPCREEG